MNHGFLDDQVSVAAYHAWHASGSGFGRDLEHWDTGIKHLVRNWEKVFPKLASLRKQLPHYAYEGWFDRLPSSCLRPGLAERFYQMQESELADMGEKAWKNFTNEVAGSPKNDRKKLLATFNEAAGYSEFKRALGERGIVYDDIFEPDGDRLRPEWQAVRNSHIVAALEVKTAFPPQQERCGRVCPDIGNGLWKKLDDHISKAKMQLRALESGRDITRMVWVVVCLDHVTYTRDDNLKTIASFLNEQSESDVEVLYDIRYGLSN